MTIKITVTEVDGAGTETVIAKRRFEVESKKQMTQGRAAKVLAREFPEARTGGRVIVSKTELGFHAMKAVRPTERCPEHYMWRHYHLAAY